MMRTMPSIKEYEEKKIRLSKMVFDDNHGVTMSVDNYKEELNFINESMEKYRGEEKGIEILNMRKNNNKKNLEGFEPAWVSYQSVASFIHYVDRLLVSLGQGKKGELSSFDEEVER